jgi:carbonic anhydrase/acetyltransferase-like protein (isoleucine patch superfamily)
MLLEYRGHRPTIGNNVFIAPTAVVIGKVTIKDNASIWYGTVVRGDRDAITIGENTNIQDNCTLHVDPGKPLYIGDNVSVGHGAVVHGCTVEDYSVVGIEAAVLNGAHILKGSFVASGAVVREGQVVGPFQLVAGVPAEMKKALDERIIEKNKATVRTYLKLAGEHKQNRILDSL